VGARGWRMIEINRPRRHGVNLYRGACTLLKVGRNFWSSRGGKLK
jgi:hypothetical protein